MNKDRNKKVTIIMKIIIIIIIMTIMIVIIIVTLPRLPPTHLEYSFVDTLMFAVRAFDFRELQQNNHSLRSLAILGIDAWVGPSKEPKILGLGTLEFEPGSFGRLGVTNVSRIVALGGSICRILRGLEAPGGPGSNGLYRLGGSAKQNKHSGIGGPRLGAWGGWK